MESLRVKCVCVICLLADAVDCSGLTLVDLANLMPIVSLCNNHQLIELAVECILSFRSTSNGQALSILLALEHPLMSITQHQAQTYFS